MISDAQRIDVFKRLERLEEIEDTDSGTAGNHTILDGTVHTDSVADGVTRGSIIYGNSTPKWDELVVGGAGTVLTSDGTDVSWAAAGAGTHTILDGSVHTDSVADTVSRGSLIIGNSTPKWDELTIGASGTFLRSDGSDPSWTAITASDIQSLTCTWANLQTFTSGITIGTAGDITMPEDGWIGIGSGSERLVFNGSDGSLAVMGANFGVGTLTPNSTSLFHIYTSGTNADFRIESDGTNGFASMRLQNDAQQWNMTVRGDKSDALFFRDVTGANWHTVWAGDGTMGVGLGGSMPSGMVHIDQNSTTAAIPVLYLDQADVSEEMIQFATTIGTGNAIEAVGAKTLTTTHFIKVTLPGSLTRYIPCGTIA